MKKILRGRILIHGFSEPFGINFEGLDGLFLCTQHFIQIHLDMVCVYSSDKAFLGETLVFKKCYCLSNLSKVRN